MTCYATAATAVSTSDEHFYGQSLYACRHEYFDIKGFCAFLSRVRCDVLIYFLYTRIICLVAYAMAHTHAESEARRQRYNSYFEFMLVTTVMP